MREILFRGKLDERIDEWIEGNLLYDSGSTAHIIGYRYWGEMGKDELLSLELISWTVIPETVGQYTELTDKNGKKIYEGDIVKMLDYQTGVVTYEFGAFGINVITGIDYDYLDSEIAEVTGCNNCSYFCRSDNFISLYELMWNYNQENDNCDVVEVIGNIYDNPELMEGADNA